MDFFAERGHTVVPSASLVPGGRPDAPVHELGDGPVQGRPNRGGEAEYVRAVDYQRCLRVAGKHNDFEEVGRTPRHHTLFEMLGNWRFGDYFKREAIHWAWEFLPRPPDPRRPARRDSSTVPAAAAARGKRYRSGLRPAIGALPAGDLQLPPIPERPTKEQARAALDMLIDLLSEFPFAKTIDRSVALAGLLTAHVRGSLPTAPVILVRADTPGTGKSYLVDLFAMISTGRLCPVITASKNAEETEKRLGAVLLGGTNIVSLDNVMHDLGGELLCQLTERPVIKICILGRSEMPECESHTAVFATGNNVAFKGDMVRRGLVCNLEALVERPELREFKKDALDHAVSHRGTYVAAALTVIRAYLTAGAPPVCGPFGSYAAWSRMVRSPLVWLGELDPIASMDAAREEDEVLSSIHEYFNLWESYGLDFDTNYTSSRVVEVACMRMDSGGQLDLNPRTFEQFLLQVAVDKNGSNISAQRLGWWMRKISGRVVAGRRLVRGREDHHVATFRLERVKDQQGE